MTLAASLVIVISCSSSSADSGGAFSRRTSYQKSIPRSRRTLIRLIDENHRQSFVRAVYLIYLYYTPSHGVGWYFDAVCVRIPIGSSSPKTTKRFYQNLFLENFSARQILWIADRLRSNRSKPCDRYNRIRLSECRFGGLFQSEATPAIVAGVCDPGGPRTAGLTEASHNAGPIATRAEKPACPCGSTPKPVTIFSFPKTTHRGVAPPRRAAPRIGAGSPTG
jgi:hypothetical protein